MPSAYKWVSVSYHPHVITRCRIRDSLSITSAFVMTWRNFVPRTSSTYLRSTGRVMRPAVPVDHVRFLFGMVVLFLVIFLLGLITGMKREGGTVVAGCAPGVFLFQRSSFLELVGYLWVACEAEGPRGKASRVSRCSPALRGRGKEV